MSTRRKFLTGSAVATRALIVPGQGNVPVERYEASLPEIAPGKEVTLELLFTTADALNHLQIDILRPTGFSVHSMNWKSGT